MSLLSRVKAFLSDHPQRLTMLGVSHVTKREPDFIIGGKDNPYIRRWWVIPRNKIFNIYLHEILRPDDDRALHDHPWHNLSLILKGGYIEHTPKGRYWRGAGHLVFRPAKTLHRLMLPLCVACNPSAGYVPCWSLFFTGPRFRDWGFQCPKGWVHWKLFTNPGDSGTVGKGCNQD